MKNASRAGLPPSSLLAWRTVMPTVDAVYVGDFDDRFNEASFWSYKDVGMRNWSRNAVSRAAILLARSLYVLASGSVLDPSEISSKVSHSHNCPMQPG